MGLDPRGILTKAYQIHLIKTPEDCINSWENGVLGGPFKFVKHSPKKKNGGSVEITLNVCESIGACNLTR